MIVETVSFPGDNVKLKAYCYEPSPEIPEFSVRPAVIVCPGGGYEYCSDREADPIATYFLAQGFNSFIFTYSVGADAAFPRPLVELSRALKLIRENSQKWHIDPEKIAVCGFSAGGHLAATLGTLWNNPEVSDLSDCQNGENFPNAIILGYPVTTTSWMENSGQLNRIIGDRDFNSTVRLLSTHKNVGKHTPPTFLFHTYNDGCVPVEDSLLFATACAENDVPFELHIYTNGGHGISTATAATSYIDREVQKWMYAASSWLWRLFGRADFGDFQNDPNRARPSERNKN
ncbi:MAG: alpha/beta hydrolase [Oscillospiraceae bacterium]